MPPQFQDHFSKQADVYSRYRPTYPPALFEYLASIAPHRTLAWDAGTGNGQAAVELAAHFEHVCATDPSAEQIAHATPHPRVDYRIERAEDVSLPDHSADLVTAGIAVHWFDLDRFYAQARRVLRPGGIIAVWVYHACAIEPAVDCHLERYYALVREYFPERFHYVAEHYATLTFPFRELTAPPFEMTAQWDLAGLLGYLETWSGTRRYREINGTNAVDLVWSEIAAAWGDPEHCRTLHWPLAVRVGQI